MGVLGGSPPTSATPVTPRQDAPMPPPPSATYQRLRQYIAERMRMSHIYQPQRRTWPAGSWGKT
jgi:hypothetical protein